MSKNLTSAHRRQIRKLIREEFKRQQIILEHMSDVHQKACLFESKAHSSGLSQEQINTGIMKIINEETKLLNEFSTGDLGFDMIKRFLAEMVLNYLGLNEDEDKIIFTLLQNVFEAIDYTQLYKFFGDETRCDEMMRVLTEAITETVTEVGGQALIKYLANKALPDAISKPLDGLIDSVLGDVSQEAINQPIVELVQGLLQEPMKEFVCGGKLTDVIKGRFSSGEGFGGLLDSIGGFFSGAGIPSF